jgi:NADPH:quinone reductase-like Zn-dependent oxidoreductase
MTERGRSAPNGDVTVTGRYKILMLVLMLVLVSVASAALTLSHDSPCGVAQPPPAGTPSMKAMVYRCYGSPDVVRLETVAKPALADDRVLVRIRAASVNPLDWHYMRGKPYIVRPMAGLGAPQDIRLGVDFAGTIEAVGKGVTRFKAGDDVFGGADGAFAEYVTVRENGPLALKPPQLTFEQAASVPIAAVTALQALRDKGQVQPGQSVLINGASGGVGTFAVQIAKALGASVTGVCSTRNLAMVQAIGADHVIDYTKEDFTRGSQRYDLIIDNVGTHSLSDYRRVLAPHGALVMVGGPNEGVWIGALSGSIRAMIVSPFVPQKLVFLLAELSPADIGYLRDLLQAGKITPVIDRRYPLRELPEAIRYLEQGHARGKVAIDVD